VKRKISKNFISIVGLGRLGTALSIALHHAGYAIGALVSRRPAQTRARIPPDLRRFVIAPNAPELLDTAAVIIATPDDQIESVVKWLSGARNAGAKPGIILHTSGVLSSRILTPLGKLGWNTGSIHPLLAVGPGRPKQNIFVGTNWCIEGDRAAAIFARKLVRDLGGHSFSISAQNKPLYHAAAVMAAGDVVALFDVALELLESCGVPRKSARRILRPLTESAVRNLVADPAQALTGPFARGDLRTVSLHLKALSSGRRREVKELFQLLGRRSTRLAERNGLEQKSVRELLKLLDR
jgi:predicted short-subunit dehydrogenase-like oxidoreductase (DUF2520 family)